MNASAHARLTHLNQRLHNSLLALAVVCVISGAGLLLARPAPPAAAAVIAAEVIAAEPAATGPAIAADAAIEAGVDGEQTIEAADPEASPVSSGAHRHARRSRQTLTMPFFSFSARS